MIFGNWKKKYFKDKLRGVDKLILDLEFKRFKTLDIREDKRIEYDNLKAKVSFLDKEMADDDAKKSDDPSKLEAGERARLDDEKVRLLASIERHIKAMEDLDHDIHGVPANDTYPEGIQGMAGQLDMLRELRLVVENAIKERMWDKW